MNSEIEHIICCTEHFISLEEKDIRNEFKNICKEAGVQDCTVFLESGGMGYVLDHIAKDDIGGGCGQLWYVQDWIKNHKE